ncbi:MAG: sensor histidine kinase [Prosthecobacter sp.]
MKSIWRLCSVAWLATLSVGWAQESFTSVQAIRELKMEQAQRRPAVNLDAVVMYYHQAWGVLFVHDGKDGICVGVPEDRRPKTPLRAGVRLHIEGVISEGEFLPVILPQTLEEKGVGVLPVYQRVSVEELFKPEMDSRPVEVEAIVKGTSFSDESLVVDVEIEGHMVRTILPQDEPLKQLPWQLVERRVQVHGVAGTHFNDQRQMSGRLLFVPGLESFKLVEEAKPEKPANLVPVNGLLRVNSPLRQRVRVRGVATHVMKGRGLYLRGEGGSMFVQTAQPIIVQLGDEVEAEGYPVVTPFRPSLSAMDVKKIGAAELPKPVEFHASYTRHSREQCELVELEADFLELTRGREGLNLVCSAEGQIFEALLSTPQLLAEEMTPGMKLRLKGICEFITTRPLVIPRNATGFRLLLRGPADVLILARRPWWNEQRALWLLGILATVAVVIGVWAVTLQVMVRLQSNVIRQQAQQQATLEERQRIARDLHDTLEQELVGVTMLLDDTTRRLNGAHPQASQPLDLARRLLRRAREESRTTIRELRSVVLEKRGLPAALEEMLRPLATMSGAEFAIEVTGIPVRLAGTLETHLLRIAQEAVANAAHHAGAKHIELLLSYTAVTVCMIVRDDGCGFDAATATTQSGHFGLSGMSERAEKIAGQLKITSQPGVGTSVEVCAPTAALNANKVPTSDS